MKNAQDTSSSMRMLNVTVAFLLEVALIISFGYWGFHAFRSTFVEWLLGIGSPVGAIVLWGIVAAPKSSHRLSPAPLTVFRIVIFTLAAVCLFLVHEKTIAIVFEAISLLNIALLFAWKQ